MSRFNWRNFFACLVISIGCVGFGYPSAMIAPMLAKASFLEFTGLGDVHGIYKHKTALAGSLGGIFQAGAIFGVLLGTQVTDRWGRKIGMLYCAFWSILGGIGVTAAPNLGAILVFRFFSGMGSWGFLSVAPTYTAELSLPAYRGLTSGMCGVMLGLGYASASYMGLAFNYTDNKAAQWRTPAGISLLWPLIILAALPFLPESPRFLLMHNRESEAWEVVVRMHASKDDPEHNFAKEEFYQMKLQAQHDRGVTASWRSLFFKRSHRKRVIFGCGLTALGQSTAVLVLQNYAPIFYAALGFNKEQAHDIQAGRDSIAFLGNLVGALLLDRYGRRRLLLIGFMGCIICVSINAAMVAQFTGTDNTAGLGVGIAALFVFLCFYASCVDAPMFVFLGEIFPNHIRARGVALAIAAFALADVLYLQIAPFAFEAIGYKFFLVFISICVVGWVWLYLKFPETKGVPLEEMAELFGDKEEVMVHLADVHIDRITHEAVEDQGNGQLPQDDSSESDKREGKASSHVEVLTELAGKDKLVV